MESVLEVRVLSPSKMKLRSPRDQRISEKSPSVESSRMQEPVLYTLTTSEGRRRERKGTREKDKLS